MSFEGFIIDTNVCLVELKGELPIGFYERLDPCVFNVMKDNIKVIFLDRFGRVMNENEIQFVEVLFWQCIDRPIVAFFSMLEQWMYWTTLNTDKLWEQVDLLEGEDDES